MKIEFYGFDASKEDFDDFCILFLKSVDAVGVEFECLQDVVVASPECYGEAIAKIDPKAEFTNTQELRGVGWACAHRAEGGRTRTSIVLDQRIVQGLLLAFDTHGPNPTAWPGEKKGLLYVIFHELGHALDHDRRPAIPTETSLTTDGRRAVTESVSAISDFQQTILADELAACAFSARACSAEFERQIAEMNDAATMKMLAEIEIHPMRDVDDLERVRRLGFDAVWFILKQHAKFVGTRIGRDLPPSSPSELWTIGRKNPDVRLALDQSENTMRKAWESYPNIRPAMRDGMTAHFVELADALGLSFEKSGRDGIWLDRDRLAAVLDAAEPQENYANE